MGQWLDLHPAESRQPWATTIPVLSRQAWQAAAERKARTHRLVEVGAIFEQATGLTFDTEDSRAILSEVLNQRLRYNDGSTSTRGEDIAAACGSRQGGGQQQ